MYKIAIITPALVVDHYAETLFQALGAIDLSEINCVRIVVGPIGNRDLIPDGWHYLVESENTRGVFDAVNQGINYAIKSHGATHVTYINCDDLLYPQFVRSIACSRNNPSAIISGRVTWLSEKGACEGLIPYWPFNMCFNLLIKVGKSPITQQGVIFPACLYSSLSGFDLSYSYIADTDFWYRARKAGNSYIFINKIVAGYRLRAGQLSSNRDEIEVEQLRWRKAIGLTKTNVLFGKFGVICMNLINLKTIATRVLISRNMTALAAVKKGGFNEK